MLYRVYLTMSGFELTMLVVIGTDCIGSCKSNYHTITTALLTIQRRYNMDITYLNMLRAKQSFLVISPIPGKWLIRWNGFNSLILSADTNESFHIKYLQTTYRKHFTTITT